MLYDSCILILYKLAKRWSKLVTEPYVNKIQNWWWKIEVFKNGFLLGKQRKLPILSHNEHNDSNFESILNCLDQHSEIPHLLSSLVQHIFWAENRIIPYDSYEKVNQKPGLNEPEFSFISLNQSINWLHCWPAMVIEFILGANQKWKN